MHGIRGKNVLVTGGSSGIGQAFAIRFAEEGANVAINCRTGAAAPSTPINRAWVDDPEKRAALERHIPLARAGTSDALAAVTAFLDSGLTLYADFLTPWSAA